MKNCLYNVLRNADGTDCTAHGLSSKVVTASLFWDCTKDEAIAYCEEHDIDPRLQFYLVKRDLWGEDHSYAEPLVLPTGKHIMFGGNFLYTSNGNGFHFRGIRCNMPIAIHDRIESWETSYELGI